MVVHHVTSLRHIHIILFMTENLTMWAKNFIICIVKVIHAQIRYSKRSIYHDKHAEDKVFRGSCACTLNNLHISCIHRV